MAVLETLTTRPAWLERVCAGLVGWLVLGAPCQGAVAPAPSPETIRVALVLEAREVTVAAVGAYRVVTPAAQALLREGTMLPPTHVTATPRGLQIGDQELLVGGVVIHAHREGRIVINGRAYRGSVTITRSADRTLLVVNHVPLEAYLASVVFHEMPDRWPVEALKAQAIASRSFASARQQMSHSRPYDLDATVSSQVYGGSSSERPRTRQAVGETTGRVLQYRGAVFPGYFHATCGGATEDVQEVWRQPLSPLQGVRCRFCSRSPHFRWRRHVDRRQMQMALAQAGHPVGEVRALTILRRTASGRVGSLRVDGTVRSTILSGAAFRQALGGTLLRSTRFSAVRQGGTVTFDGEGWGHGVGLCQWGAYGMARRGWSAEQILGYYYPGTEIAQRGVPPTPGGDDLPDVARSHVAGPEAVAVAPEDTRAAERF